MSLNVNPLSGAELAAFVAAVETGSIHAAADALDLTAPAVTKRIQGLERRLGVSLFDRGRFGIRATDAGRILYPEAKQALLALQRTATALDDYRSAADQRLALAASHTIGEFLLPGWLEGFRRQQPRLRAQVEIVNSRGVLRALREHEAEIGFVEGLDDLAGFETHTLARDEIVAVVAAGHSWCRRASVPVRALARQPLFAREPGSGTRAVAEAALARAGVTLTPALEAASTQSLKRALSSGGFALISRLAIEAEQMAGTLRGIPVAGVDMTRRLVAVHDRRQPPHGIARAFWQWLQTHSPCAQ